MRKYQKFVPKSKKMKLDKQNLPSQHVEVSDATAASQSARKKTVSAKSSVGQGHIVTGTIAIIVTICLDAKNAPQTDNVRDAILDMA